jgi:acyl-coenzyme A synthetase/AMP-(fatty) acid ligase
MKGRNKLGSELIDSFNKNGSLVAIQDQYKFLTYSDLHDQIKICQDLLTKSDFKAGDRILIVGEKSCDMLVAMLACVISGIVYIPIELPMPELRLQSIATNTAVAGRFDIGRGLIKFGETFLKTNDILIFYTSGSTGQPKGVRINEFNILNFVAWVKNQYNISSSDRFCASAPWHFDLSILDIYVALLSGASIHCPSFLNKSFPYQMVQWLNERQITIVYMVPTAVRHLIKHGKWNENSHNTVRCILFAGEIFHILEVQQLRRMFPNTIISNLYGPTETNVCSYCMIPDLNELLKWSEIPIGHAITNFELFVWNKNGGIENQISAEGELICCGLGVNPGYINKNSDKFFLYENKPAYCTGDLVRITDKGLVFLGRNDRQIKLFGYRIDLCEIEFYLRQHNSVFDAAVCVVDKKIIAFIIANQSFKIENLASYCLKYFPNYYCPHKFISIKEMPLTLSEKIDYQKLLSDEYLSKVSSQTVEY